MNPGGVLIVDGRINQDAVSVSMNFRDDSSIHTRGIWRCDYNLHSEYYLKEILDQMNDVRDFWFEHAFIDVPIDRGSKVTDMDGFTIIDGEGRYRITNGAKIFNDPAFMIVRKK